MIFLNYIAPDLGSILELNPFNREEKMLVLCIIEVLFNNHLNDTLNIKEILSNNNSFIEFLIRSPHLKML